MGLVAFLVMWPEQFVQMLANLYNKETSYEIWVQLA